MPNKNYERGVRFERKVKKMWEEAGYLVLRTAGSHGFADLVAVNTVCTNVGDVAFIQCKTIKNGTKRQAVTMADKFCENPPLSIAPAYLQVIEVYAMKDKHHEIGIT